jgi:hypothetical protein
LTINPKNQKTMKRLKLFDFLCGIILVTALSCDKINNDTLVNFKFRLLDEQGNEKTVFNEGENVIFSFFIENKTSEDLTFYQHEMNTDDFFRLYKINSTEGVSDLGKPYFHIFCDKILLKVPANGIFKIEIPWLWYENQNYGYIGCPHEYYHNDTFPLTSGDYRTTFSSTFKIGDIQTEEKHFEIKFTVN